MSSINFEYLCNFVYDPHIFDSVLESGGRYDYVVFRKGEILDFSLFDTECVDLVADHLSAIDRRYPYPLSDTEDLPVMYVGDPNIIHTMFDSLGIEP